MSDLIDRQAALDAFELSEKTRKYGGDHSGYDTRMLYEIQNVLEDLPSAQPKTEERMEKSAQNIPKGDLVSRKGAIDAFWQLDVEICPSAIDAITNMLKSLPPVKPETTADAEFWRKRADYYSDMCFKLIADMGAGVKIEAVKIDETGITFTKKKPSAQSEPISDAYAKAVRTWLVQYQVKCAELQGRYTPYEILGWIVSDWRKENGIW